MLTLGASGNAFAWIMGNTFLTVGTGAFVLILGGLAAVLLSVIWSSIARAPRPMDAAAEARRKVRPVVGAVSGALLALLTYWLGTAIAVVDAMVRTPGAIIWVPYFTIWGIGLVFLGGTLGYGVARYRWHGAGVWGYIGLLAMIVGYIAYAWTVTIPAVPDSERWLSYVLLAAEGSGLALIGVFSFYTIDAMSRRRWLRRPGSVPYDPGHLPKVAFEVPVFNESPEMVERTVQHLVAQDYPKDRFMVVVADDSTDEEAREKNREMCKRLGAYHAVREDRRGFKAGALNHVNRLLDPDVELVAVVDADYWVAPDYLRSVVGYFVDRRLGFLQTPQDYRNLEESFLTRRYQQAEAYFYHGIMPSRNEENTIIFCGTMGVIRRSALQAVGGFAEDQICEDAEVSVRLAAAGWRSLYIDQSFGKGLMPAVFDSYKKQYHRWAFGNVRIMFSRFGLIMRSRMTARQKIDFLLSGLHWFDGFFVAAIGLILLYLGIGPILGYDLVSHHQREIALLAIVPLVLILDSLFRLHHVLRRGARERLGKRIGLRDTLLVQGMWFAIKMTNVRAVTKSMLGFKTPFVRTPKHPGRKLGIAPASWRALRLTKPETAMGVALLGVGAYNFQPDVWVRNGDFGFLLPAWLTLYALFFLTAPIYAYLSYRTLRPLVETSITQPMGRPQPVPEPVRRRVPTVKVYGSRTRARRVAPLEARARRPIGTRSVLRARAGVPVRR